VTVRSAVVRADVKALLVDTASIPVLETRVRVPCSPVLLVRVVRRVVLVKRGPRRIVAVLRFGFGSFLAVLLVRLLRFLISMRTRVLGHAVHTKRRFVTAAVAGASPRIAGSASTRRSVSFVVFPVLMEGTRRTLGVSCRSQG
jgi:hypothetical protein